MAGEEVLDVFCRKLGGDDFRRTICWPRIKGPRIKWPSFRQPVFPDTSLFEDSLRNAYVLSGVGSDRKVE